MTFISAEKDPVALTFTFVSEFAAPIEKVWQIWEDPRKLERWWGPPTYPATFEVLDFAPGGRAFYFMTGPEGDKHHGAWGIEVVEAPSRLEFMDGFADESGTVVETPAPARAVVTLEALAAGGTRMTICTTFPSLESMEQMAEMGMVEGMTLALGQIDALLG